MIEVKKFTRFNGELKPEERVKYLKRIGLSNVIIYFIFENMIEYKSNLSMYYLHTQFIIILKLK